MNLTAELLDWSQKQGRILTGGGVAEDLFTAKRGFPYTEEDLPHYLLRNALITQTFPTWLEEDRTGQRTGIEAGVVGAWTRPLFLGGYEHSTLGNEHVFNLQTPSIFIDIRIPVLKRRYFESRKVSVLNGSSDGLATLDEKELSFFARQHAFCGYSRMEKDENGAFICTRHHAIDWNFVGKPRSRPNKWRIELNPNSADQWKEWSHATDDHGQSYYMERWERLPMGGDDTYFALEKVLDDDDCVSSYIVAVGDHFNYIRQREPSFVLKDKEEEARAPVNLTKAIDEALANGDESTVQKLMSLEVERFFSFFIFL
jgi:hypothetical protein